MVKCGLLDSIQENKNGKSEEDAFVVINVHEEYTFFGSAICGDKARHEPEGRPDR